MTAAPLTREERIALVIELRDRAAKSHAFADENRDSDWYVETFGAGASKEAEFDEKVAATIDHLESQLRQCAEARDALRQLLARYTAVYPGPLADPTLGGEARTAIAAPNMLTYCDAECVGLNHSESHLRREAVAEIDSEHG